MGSPCLLLEYVCCAPAWLALAAFGCFTHGFSMVRVEDFFASPSEDLLDACSREELVKIAESYGIDVGDKRQKERVRAILRSNLLEKVSPERPPMAAPPPASGAALVGMLSSVAQSSFSFEQQKELLMLQIEHDKFKLQAELEKELVVGKMRQQLEQARLGVEQSRLAD